MNTQIKSTELTESPNLLLFDVSINNPNENIINDIHNIFQSIFKDVNNRFWVTNQCIEVYFEDTNSNFNININNDDIVRIGVVEQSGKLHLNGNNSIEYTIPGIFNKYFSIAKEILEKRNDEKFKHIYSFFNNKYKLNREKNLKFINEESNDKKDCF